MSYVFFLVFFYVCVVVFPFILFFFCLRIPIDSILCISTAIYRLVELL